MQFVEPLGWMLIHSVWQIAAIGLAYAMFVSIARGRSSRARYAAGCVSLLLMALAPLTTLALEGVADRAFDRPSLADATRPAERARPSADIRSDASTSSGAERKVPEHASQVAPPESREVAGGSWLEAGAIASRIRSALPWMVGTWLCGIAVFSWRPAIGWYSASRLRRIGVTPVSDDVRDLVARIARKTGLRRSIDVFQSALTSVPAVVGVLRPTLLLSVGVITGLSRSQLEAVVAHELAHVRRHDFLVNALQTVLETLLFFHPMVWWVSRQVREERENCCDDLALSVMEDRADYAEMLLKLERSRRLPEPALAADGGSLLRRVRRIASPDHAPSGGAGSVLGGTLTLLSVACLVGLWYSTAAAEPVVDDGTSPTVERPAAGREDDEGVYSLEVGVASAADKRKKPAVEKEVDRLDDEGFAPLHRAASGGHVDRVASLLKAGADVDARQATYQGTPLQYAAARGHDKVVELLIAAGAQVDSADKFGRTPLMWAADKGHPGTARLLVKYEADVDAKTNNGWTALVYAERSGNTEIVRLLKPITKVLPLEDDPETPSSSVNELDEKGFSKLHRAAIGGHVEKVASLLKAGADVDIRQAEFQGTPLQYAAARGHADVVKLLIAAGAKVDSADRFGRTPLMWAAEKGQAEVARQLLRRGADVQARTNTGWTPLRYAIDRGHSEIAELLIARAIGEQFRD